MTEEQGYGRATSERLARSLDIVSRVFDLKAALSPRDLYFEGLAR